MATPELPKGYPRQLDDEALEESLAKQCEYLFKERASLADSRIHGLVGRIQAGQMDQMRRLVQTASRDSERYARASVYIAIAAIFVAAAAAGATGYQAWLAHVAAQPVSRAAR
jgi:hypothetical protein